MKSPCLREAERMTETFPCPSQRFVLSDDAALLRNLAALWAVDPKLAAALDLLDDHASYPVEQSRAGAPTVAVPNPSGKPVYLHSRHQPLDEAKRLIGSIDFDAKLVFYVHGFGLGYHVTELFDRASDEAIVFIFEPDLLLIRTAMEVTDLTSLIESRRVYFIYQPDKSDLLQKLTPQSAMVSLGSESVVHAPSLSLHKEFHTQAQQWLAEFASFSRTSMNTLVLNGKLTAENITRNLAWYASAPGIERLKDRYTGKPAIIVSAGPSLRKNKHLLPEAAGRAVIISVQTMLQPLLDAGVTPQFVTSLDYHDLSTRFFERVPRDLSTELVAEPKATAGVLSIFPRGRMSILGNDYAENLLREVKINKPKLSAGATVAHLAYYLAEHLGCDPIIFVGQDLGFSDGLYYAPGTSYEDAWRPEFSRFCSVEMKQWEQIVRDRHLLRRIPDVNGQPMYTEERLFSYLQQFERDFGRSTRKIIDATEGGALKRGSTPMTLREAIDTYCTSVLPAMTEDHPGLTEARLAACLDSLRLRVDEADRIEQIARDTLPLLKDIADHLGEQERVNQAIVRIDKLRAQMDGLGATYDLISQFTQKTELKRFEQDRRIAASGVSGVDKQKRQVERDMQNVQAISDAAAAFRESIRQAIQQMESRLASPARREA